MLYKAEDSPPFTQESIFRISIARSNHERDHHFQTIQVQPFFSFLRDVVKFPDWTSTKICTFANSCQIAQR